MKKFSKILYILIIFAMVLQVAPAFGGLAATEETYITAEDYETAEIDAIEEDYVIAEADGQDYVAVVATSNGDTRVELQAVANAAIEPHNTVASTTPTVFPVVGYNARNFIAFDATVHAHRADELERATLRLHFQQMNNPIAAPAHGWAYFLPVYIWDAWPENGLRWWNQGTIVRDNIWGLPTTAGNAIWRHLQTVAPENAIVAAPLYSPTAWSAQASAWHLTGYAGQPTLPSPDLTRLPLTATNAFLYQDREPGSIITGFVVDKVPDKWFEIDITDFVRASMRDSGTRLAYPYSRTGTGWGRDGYINLGFNGGPAHQRAPGGAAALRMNFSTLNSTGAFANHGPQLVLEFTDPDPPSTIVVPRPASMGAQGMNVTDFGNFGRPPDDVIFNDNLAIWTGGAPDTPNEWFYGNGFVQFDVSDLRNPPTGYRIADATLRLRTVGVDGAELGNLTYWNRHVLLQIRPRTVMVSLTSDNWDQNMTPYNMPSLTLGEHPGILDTMYRTVTPVNQINTTQEFNVTEAFEFLGYGGNTDVLSFRLHTHGSGPQFWTEFAGVNHPNEEFRPTLIVTYVECNEPPPVIWDRLPNASVRAFGEISQLVEFGSPWDEISYLFDDEFPRIQEVTYQQRGTTNFMTVARHVDWPGFTAEWNPIYNDGPQTITGRIGAPVYPALVAGLDLRDNGVRTTTGTIMADEDFSVPAPAMPINHPGFYSTTIPLAADAHSNGWGENQFIALNAPWFDLRTEHTTHFRFNAGAYTDYRGTLESAVLRFYVQPPTFEGNGNIQFRAHGSIPVSPIVVIDNWTMLSRSGNRPGPLWTRQEMHHFSTNPASGQPQVAHAMLAQNAQHNRAFYTFAHDRLEQGALGAFVGLVGVGQGYGSGWVEVDITEYVRLSMNPSGTFYDGQPLAGTGWGRDGHVNVALKSLVLPGGGGAQWAGVRIATSFQSERAAHLVLNFNPYEVADNRGDIIEEIRMEPVEIGALDVNMHQTGWQANTRGDVSTILPVRVDGVHGGSDRLTPESQINNLAESYLKFDVSELAEFDRDEILDMRLRLTVHSVRDREINQALTNPNPYIRRMPRMVVLSVARNNWTYDTLNWANRPILPFADMPDNIGFIYNAQVGETIYVDVTQALNYLDAGGIDDYLTLRLFHGGLSTWDGGFMATNFHSTGANAPQLIVRTVESTDGFSELNLINDGMVAEVRGQNLEGDAAVEATLFAVMFVGGRFVSAVNHPITLPMGADDTWSQTVTIVGNGVNYLEDISGATVRAFLWQGDGGLMRPVRGITAQETTLQ